MQATNVGFCYVVIRCVKSARWFERTFRLDTIRALPHDLKILIRYESFHYASRFLGEIAQHFYDHPIDGNGNEVVCGYIPFDYGEEYIVSTIMEVGSSSLHLHTETIRERDWRLAMEAERRTLGVDAFRIGNLAAYTKYLDAPHGGSRFVVPSSLARHFHRTGDLEYFLDELLRDALTKFSLMLPIRISLAKLQLEFSTTFFATMEEGRGNDNINSIFIALGRKQHKRCKHQTSGSGDGGDWSEISAFIPFGYCSASDAEQFLEGFDAKELPNWVGGYFEQYLIKQSEGRGGGVSWCGAYARSLPLFMFGRSDETSPISALPTEITQQIARLVMTW